MLIGSHPVLEGTEPQVMDEFVVRHNRERTTIGKIPLSVHCQELWVPFEGTICWDANTIGCGNIDRHEANRMIDKETRCLFSQRIADNLVVDHSFPALQLPNTNNLFR